MKLPENGLLLLLLIYFKLVKSIGPNVLNSYCLKPLLTKSNFYKK